tara:strand:- start:662 stop:895 length:234 start_codon:yes stop_codon:yes gene_type:complete
MSIRDISSGWLNYIKSKFPNLDTKEIERIAKQREDICIDCESLKFNRIFSRYICSECNCAFPAILYSSQKKCPLDKW